MRFRLIPTCALVALFAAPAPPTELKSETAVAFDRYVQAAEGRMADDLNRDQFLAIDRLPQAQRAKAYRRIRSGEIYIQRIHATEEGRPIEVPSGLIHDWVAVTFVPDETLPNALAVLQDFDTHQDIYKPEVRKSRLLERNGDSFKIYLQFYEKSIVTAVFNANFDVKFEELGVTRFEGASRSTRIAEVQNFDKSDERELPVGKDRGFLWRLNSYWRGEEKDGGVYLQNESIGLTRRVPAIVAWFVNPLLDSIPRTLLSKLLIGTREGMAERRGTSSGWLYLRSDRLHSPKTAADHETSLTWFDDGNAAEHADPSRRALVVRRDQPQRTESVGNGLSVERIGNQYAGILHATIQLGKRENNGVTVCALSANVDRQRRPAQR
jgi:hypothetical protein